jgi:hypothetical protein
MAKSRKQPKRKPTDATMRNVRAASQRVNELREAVRSLALWPFWSRLIRGLGHVPAFVAQDGITHERMPSDVGVLFIGGTTAFKEGTTARSLIAYAKARGLWVHCGRVNGRRRYEMMLKSGCDSIDGTGFSMYPDTNIPLAREWHVEIQQQPELGLDAVR